MKRPKTEDNNAKVIDPDDDTEFVEAKEEKIKVGGFRSSAEDATKSERENKPRVIHIENDLTEGPKPEALTKEEIDTKTFSVETFAELPCISDKLKEVLEMSGFKKMTPVQAEAIPAILQ